MVGRQMQMQMQQAQAQARLQQAQLQHAPAHHPHPPALAAALQLPLARSNGGGAAAYPLLTPSGRALSVGGRVQNVSRDPLVPCVMYWPDNEPLPEQGQIRPVGSAVISVRARVVIGVVCVDGR